MKNNPTEKSFARGLKCLRDGKTLEALAYFEVCMRLEERKPNPARRARYASYYGYCLAAALGRKGEGLRICRRAAGSEFFTPEILLNLARVELLVGSRKKAWAALMKGMRLDPQHRGLRAEMRRMGVRRRPVLPFLEREHPINRAAGKLAAKVNARNGDRPGRRKS